METIKKSIICKNVSDYFVNDSIIKNYQPKAGDVAIFKVLKLGSLKAIQDADGRNCHIFEGDKIMVTFGNRYASNQFEGYLPISYRYEYDLIGKGGVAGVVKSMFHKLELLGPTKLSLVGYATNREGKVINTIYHNMDSKKFNPDQDKRYQTILSIGSSMDSGKTTSAAFLCRGLKKAGNKVAFIKLTGTVFNKDRMLAYDCGADIATDFSELGFPSTYLCSLDCLMDLYQTLLSKVESIDPDYVVMEIADGILQRETELLLTHQPFLSTIDQVLFSCGDSLSGIQGVKDLRSKGIEPTAVSGLINTCPLLVEELKNNLNLPILNLEQLASSKVENTFKGNTVPMRKTSKSKETKVMLEVA